MTNCSHQYRDGENFCRKCGEDRKRESFLKKSDVDSKFTGSVIVGKRGYFIAITDGEVTHQLKQKEVKNYENKTGITGQDLADLLASKCISIRFSYNGKYGSSHATFTKIQETEKYKKESEMISKKREEKTKEANLKKEKDKEVKNKEEQKAGEKSKNILNKFKTQLIKISIFSEKKENRYGSFDEVTACSVTIGGCEIWDYIKEINYDDGYDIRATLRTLKSQIIKQDFRFLISKKETVFSEIGDVNEFVKSLRK